MGALDPIEAPGARWVSTACDNCHSTGFYVLVPVGSDGKPRASHFPGLCWACAQEPAVRKRFEREP